MIVGLARAPTGGTMFERTTRRYATASLVTIGSADDDRDNQASQAISEAAGKCADG